MSRDVSKSEASIALSLYVAISDKPGMRGCGVTMCLRRLVVPRMTPRERRPPWCLYLDLASWSRLRGRPAPVRLRHVLLCSRSHVSHISVCFRVDESSDRDGENPRAAAQSLGDRRQRRWRFISTAPLKTRVTEAGGTSRVFGSIRGICRKSHRQGLTATGQGFTQSSMARRCVTFISACADVSNLPPDRVIVYAIERCGDAGAADVVGKQAG